MQSRSPERKSLVNDLKDIATIDGYSKSEYHKAYCKMYHKYIGRQAREKKAIVKEALKRVDILENKCTPEKEEACRDYGEKVRRLGEYYAEKQEPTFREQVKSFISKIF